MQEPDISRDDDLLRLYADGDLTLEELFPQLFDIYYPLLLRQARAYQLPPEVAEELVQNTFLGVYEYLRSHTPAVTVRAWLLTVFRREIYNYLRASHGSKRDAEISPQIDVSAPTPSPEEQSVTSEEARLVREALVNALTPEDSKLLLLHFAEDKSYAEIATELGISVSAVKSRLNVVRRRLREYMESGIRRVR